MTAGDANARLEKAFLKLVEEKPFAKITVNDIVKEAGVHRNTFYYHYQSIPAMLSEICQKMVAKMVIIYKDVQSPSDCILPLVRYSKEHKMAILHVYYSDARQVLMDYVRQIGRFSVERYIDSVTERTGISRHDKEIKAADAVCDYYKVEHITLDLSTMFQFSDCSLLKHSDEEIPEGAYDLQLKETNGKKMFAIATNNIKII